MMDVTRVITQDYGYPFEYYDIPEFVEQMNQRCTREDLLCSLVDFFNSSHPKIAAMQHKRYNSDEYRRARAESGNEGRDPSLDDTVSYLMKFMLKDGIISEKVRRSEPDLAAGLPPQAQDAKRKAK